MILLIDNYDSFAHNLARYFKQLGQQVVVVRNDQIDLPAVTELNPDAIVISPGPCTPEQAGISIPLVQEFVNTFPILGICLGHQAIAAALGGTVRRAKRPVHGQTSQVLHDQRGIFASDIPNPFQACRYHSLIVDDLPDCLEVSAWTEDKIIMGFRHRERPIVGVQFHPESILSEAGYALLHGFLLVAGMNPVLQVPTIQNELAVVPRRELQLPDVPVTF